MRVTVSVIVGVWLVAGYLCRFSAWGEQCTKDYLRSQGRSIKVFYYILVLSLIMFGMARCLKGAATSPIVESCMGQCSPPRYVD